MIKFNRIGNKLGLAGALGIMLSVGMVANQMMSEAEVEAANKRAARAQRVIDGVMAGQLELRQIQLAARNIQLARKPADVEQGLTDLRSAKASQSREIEAALASAQRQETKDRLTDVKSLMESYADGVEDLAKSQKTSLEEVEKRNTISGEWYRAFQTALNSSVFARIDSREEVEGLFYQADAKVNALRALVWRLGATGDTKLVETITHSKTQLASLLKQTRDKADDKKLHELVDGLGAIINRFLGVTDDSMTTDSLKADIIRRSTKLVEEAGTLMETQVGISSKNAKASREEAAAEVAKANQINLALAVVVVVALIASMIFSFFGISRPMTRLNGALHEMAAGNLDVVIPGAGRGDEIGDLAKTVTVIRQNAETKARDEADERVSQEQLAAERRK